MSQKKKQQPVASRPIKKQPVPPVKPVAQPLDFSVPYPQLWLALVPLILYAPSLYFKFTELDDTIFIRDFSGYNEHLHNLITSFGRGLFTLKDTYYRPIFLDSMIINYHLSGTDIMSYHFFNIVFHIISVLLLYTLFRRLNVRELHAFILTLIFAVHPVLSQAVAWIPGRNDTLLALFTLPFLIYSIEYARTGKVATLALSSLFLLLAYFTKETAVFAAPVAFLLLVFLLQQHWLDRRLVTQYGVWAVCFIVWFIFRYHATLHSSGLATGKFVSDFIYRLPLVIQYIGKIFLPVNLSVFPIQEDTVYYYGIIAICVLAAIIFLDKQRNWKMIGSGLAVFLLLLFPVLLIPNDLNQQTFEHRLYLPVVGILLVLPQTILLKNTLKDRSLLIAACIVCAVLSFINYEHQQNFSDPLTFWSSASATSPHSAYADMMLGARINDLKESDELFRKAYQLNPKEKYLNFYYGVMLQKEDSVQQSEKYLLAEKKISDYYECDFYLARVVAERKNFSEAITYLQNYLARDPANKMAHNNLLLLLLQTNQRDKAITEVKTMQQSGMEVPKQIMEQLGL